jgi:hypothetical protein
MLAVYSDERAAESAPREQMTEIVNAYTAYTKALQDAKVLVGSNRLRPTSAVTTARTVDGQTRCSTDRSPRPRSSSAAIT